MPAAGLREAVALAGRPLGVAALFVPGLVAAYGTRAAVGGWLFQAVAGGLLMTAAAGLDGASGAGDLAARRAGPAGRAVVAGWYAVGTSAGQAVVALVVGGYLGIAVGASGSAATWLAAGALAVAAVLAGRLPAGPAWWPVAGLLVVLVVVAVRPGAGGAAPGPGSGAGHGSVPEAAFVLLFAMVGIESAVRARPRAVPGGWALAGAGFLVAALAARAAADPELGLLPGRVTAVLAAAVAGTYLVRNLAGAAAQGRLAAPAARGWPVAVTAGAALGLGLVAAGVVRPVDVLAVPSAMALAIFLTVAVAAVLGARGPARAAGAAALVLYAALLPAAGAALLWPLAVLVLVAARTALPTRRPRPEEEASCR
jgi:hypothetical protein